MKVYANHTTRWRDMRKYIGLKRMKRVLKHVWLSGIIRAKENPEAVKYELLRQRYDGTPHVGTSLHEEVFFDPDRPYTDYRDTVWPERVPLHKLAIP